MSKAIPKQCMALLEEASEMFEETGCVPGIDGEQVPAERIVPDAKEYIFETIENPKAIYDPDIWDTPGLYASTDGEIDAAFEDIIRQKINVLIIATDPFLLGQRNKIVELAARYAVPTMYFLRQASGRCPLLGPVVSHDCPPSHREASARALNSHCDNGPASNPIRLKRWARFFSTANKASGPLATFTSRTILPASSTMQMLVSLTETSSPAKWSMLRFSF